MTVPFTPGPWNVQSHDLQQRIKAGAATIALPCMNDHVSALQCSANARLISAAPDLLAALEELIAEWDAMHADEDHRTGYTLDTGGIRMARAAIARATGGEA
jgi:hypothetical protein